MANHSNKTLLIICAGIESIPGYIKAKNLGLYLLGSDINKEAPALKFADESLIACTYDINKTVKIAKEYHKNKRNIDGVISIGSDIPLTVARVSHEINVPSISINTALLASDKLAMKNQFKRTGVSIPWYSEVLSSDHLNEIRNNINSKLIIKPADSRGARGVLLLSPSIKSDWAFSYSKKFSPSNKVIIEEFIDGPQISTESIVINGKCYTVGFSDRNYEFLQKYKPHVIENGGDLPTNINEKIKVEICKLMELTANSFGLKNGILKGDIVLRNKEQPVVIEAATRLSGGYFCSHKIPLNTGIDLVSLAIRQVLGEEINQNDLIPKWNQPVSQRYWFPPKGIVKEIKFLKNFENNSDIKLLEIRVKTGDEICDITNHPSRAGVVITTGKTRQAAIKLAEEIIENVKIITY